MNRIFLQNLLGAGLLSILSFGCSVVDKNSPTESGTSQTNAPTATNQSTEKTAAEPCANIYNPVKDGDVKIYKMSIGGKDAKFVQKYTEGAADFSEELTVGETTVKHNWECTDEGLIAANPGSMMNSQNMQLEPKHISGVTLPKDSEIKVGKTWTTAYQAAGKSPVGDISSQVTVNNKVISLDDEVKVPAGTFKAVKVETILDIEMKLGDKKLPTAPIKTMVWYAPNIGMIKNGETGTGSTMEYVGDK